jgi:hypothetical protein
MKYERWIGVVVLWLTLMPGSVVTHAQDTGAVYPLFEDDTPLALKLSAPLRHVFRDNPDRRRDYEAILEWIEPDGRAMSREIEVRIRGRSRIEFCRFPPLSLDFRQSDDDGTEFDGTVFEGQNRLKLVVLCDGAGYYEDYLAREYLIYRMLNLLTERSFRVRWAEMEYVDTVPRRPRVRSAPAFLIESDWEIAERVGMALVETEILAVESLDVAHSALLAVFGYLVGNTDWALLEGPAGEPCCHNGKVLRGPGGAHFIVPYDFDNSGLVDANYAVPSDLLPIRSVRRRLYRGFCAFDPSLDAAIAAVTAHRERLLAVFDDPLISERGREDALDYLEESFEIIDDPERRREELNAECRP